jgi:hypothetical protein
MRTGARHASRGSIGSRAAWSALIAAVSAGMFWLVWIYGSGLRDPRYLDGWLLASGMALQLYYHLSAKRGRLTPKSMLRWQRVHIFVGYLLIAVFLSHCDFSLPDTGLEWALWTAFVLVTMSGVLGTYLSWSLRTRHVLDESVVYERIPALRAELAERVHALAFESDPAPTLIALPPPPDEAWISDLYTAHLHDFFHGQRNSAAHLIGSKRPLKRLTDEIDNLSRYVGRPSQDKLVAIRALAIEKDRLDFACVYLGLTRGWLLVHVPVTYSLVVLTVLHILVVYSYSAGLW